MSGKCRYFIANLSLRASKSWLVRSVKILRYFTREQISNTTYLGKSLKHWSWSYSFTQKYCFSFVQFLALEATNKGIEKVCNALWVSDVGGKKGCDVVTNKVVSKPTFNFRKTCGENSFIYFADVRFSFVCSLHVLSDPLIVSGFFFLFSWCMQVFLLFLCNLRNHDFLAY